jgi:uncharacterized protein (TIGR00251 family)
MSFIQQHPQGVLLKIYVQPRSSMNQISGLYGDALKIKLTAPPVDSKANSLCIAFLSKCLGVPKSALEIIAGHTSRSKKLLYRTKTDDLRRDLHILKNRIESLTEMD